MSSTSDAGVYTVFKSESLTKTYELLISTSLYINLNKTLVTSVLSVLICPILIVYVWFAFNEIGTFLTTSVLNTVYSAGTFNKLYPSLVSCTLFPIILNFLNLLSAVSKVTYSPLPFTVGNAFKSSFNLLFSSFISAFYFCSDFIFMF